MSRRPRRRHRRGSAVPLLGRRWAVAALAGTLAAGGTAAALAPAGWAAHPTPSASPSSSPSSSPSGSGSTSALGFDPDDTGAPQAITRIVGAQQAWTQGWTGSGVDVAVIDTGVAPVRGLDAPGQVVTGPDLSFDSPDAPTPGLDAYGHGTFMAGLIAGRDAATGAGACPRCLTSSPFSDVDRYVGVAPEARVVDVKVGAADGAVDVSQVIAAIDWTVQHAHDPGFNIKVISLSYGTDSVQQYDRDPLAQAAEQAWKHGVTVVAAAGNDGRGPGKVADPAYDPYLIAVGADDPMATLAVDDDRVPDWAQHGTRTRPVDVVAPGAHAIGLSVPGGWVDTQAGNTGRLGTRFQRGSGTSQATAVVAGAVALLAQKYPAATPDTLKALLTTTARPMAKVKNNDNTTELYAGSGLIDVAAALSATPAAGTQTWDASTGAGSLDKSRAKEYVTDGTTDLRGDQDIFGRPFDAAGTAALQAQGRAWTGGLWNSSRWTGDGWSSSRWTSSRWTGVDWAGNAWTSSRWTGMTWDSSRWTGSGWGSSRWTSSRWTGANWSTAAWS